eukprot:CAMPEP_0197430662 /NCGR_PEP_ID=MMETSP1170-20131217/52081_1 /TAXON_ID=54406 /ORGANISM="Sarcinochrysis sp, Strain CCMP770" /LENGTH=103 /DNA_ID=CAMNT_0042958581 /DNA_START=36 /DNA_END=345 /DNA_ORIENTATION=-
MPLLARDDSSLYLRRQALALCAREARLTDDARYLSKPPRPPAAARLGDVAAAAAALGPVSTTPRASPSLGDAVPLGCHHPRSRHDLARERPRGAALLVLVSFD